MVKITITTDKIEVASKLVRQPKRKLTVDLDVTGLDSREIVDALLDLASSLETRASREDKLAELRAAVAIHDETLTTTTRFVLKDEDAIKVFAAGRLVGSARFHEIRPVIVRATPTDRGHIGFGWEDTAAIDAEPEGEDYLEFDEDEEVEFYRAQEWHTGVIIERTGTYTWLVEDKDSKRWEANQAGIRPTEANYDDW